MLRFLKWCWRLFAMSRCLEALVDVLVVLLAVQMQQVLLCRQL